MFLQKNGHIFRQFIAAFAALAALPGLSAPLAADCDLCYEESYWDPCAADVPTFTIYADFIYWQVHPEGLEFARIGGLGADETTAVDKNGAILSPECEMEPGFRVGTLIDLDCCNWDFYAQYTWLNQGFDLQATSQNTADQLQPLIFNRPFNADPANPLTFARGEWCSTYNVLDFGLGRTFSINCCFDFRPHLGFKASWQNLDYNVRYEVSTTANKVTQIQRVDIHNSADYSGIGLRGGFDAAWRFSPCLRLMGGVALSAVWSDVDVTREDSYTPNTLADKPTTTKNLGFDKHRCALVPVAELLLGLRYDTTFCRYDVFAFVGWENQIWFNLNRFLFVSGGGINDGFQFGPHGNVTYQGLTVRGGFGF